MNDRPSDLAQLRVLLRQLSRGELLIIAERAVELVPSAGLASLLGDFLQIEVSGEGCVNFGVMKQQNLAMAADAQSGFEQHRKPTRRDEFLKTMDALVPWDALCDEIAPHYPKAGNGRPPIELDRMLRIHFIQLNDECL